MPKSTTSDVDRGAALPRFVWTAFGILIACTYLIGLNFSFVGPDEPRYAQVAREMMQRGDWITPTLGGYPWFEKPVLLYWLEIVSYKIFGVSEAAARFGPALCGLGIVIALFAIGRTLQWTFGCGIGGYIALVGASTLGLIAFAHGASFDIVLTFPITAALAAFWRYEACGKKTTTLVWFYFFIGVSLLAKGLIGIVLPVGIVTAYYVLTRKRPSGQLPLSLVWGTILSTAVAAVWYVPMYVQNGWRFIDEFIVQQHFARFVSNKYQHAQPFYFFLWVLPLMILPWLPFFLLGVWKGIKNCVTPASDDDIRDITLFGLSWVVVPLLFFSVSGSKLPSYILPAVSGAVILAAIVAHSLAAKSVVWKSVVIGLAGSTLAIVLTLALTVVPKYADEDSVKSLVDAAVGSGHTTQRVLMLRTTSHAAEFYAAGRLEYDPTGQLVEHYGASEIADYIRSNGGSSVLVLVPRQYEQQLNDSNDLVAHPLSENGDLTIASVSLR
ncbi:MAG TPA: glycosyltransferase family 39 protein [Pyrinomonadaceae bacterium]|jgi:4-amino-4-deoxy-L-arabinose transferase-like glycosyltransferase